MKKVIIFAVAFVAVFAVSLKVNSTPKGIDPNYYCKYDDKEGICSEDANGWDGTYNGVSMPSTDYWYVIDIEEIDMQYTGHFTLVRQ